MATVTTVVTGSGGTLSFLIELNICEGEAEVPRTTFTTSSTDQLGIHEYFYCKPK